ncbi:hypothetical protein U1Q18_031839 [Sarracenia purpurea var. burkii]
MLHSGLASSLVVLGRLDLCLFGYRDRQGWPLGYLAPGLFHLVGWFVGWLVVGVCWAGYILARLVVRVSRAGLLLVGYFVLGLGCCSFWGGVLHLEGGYPIMEVVGLWVGSSWSEMDKLHSGLASSWGVLGRLHLSLFGCRWLQLAWAVAGVLDLHQTLACLSCHGLCCLVKSGVVDPNGRVGCIGKSGNS